MRSLAQIQQRIRHLIENDLERRMAREVLPHLCQHNHRQPLDHRRTIYGEPNGTFNRISAGVVDGVSLPVVQTIGLCMLGSEWPETWAGAVCEEPLDALRCPVFVHRQSALDVYHDFVRDLQDLPWLEANLPEVASLLWVIDAGVIATAAPRPWWVRLWVWVLTGPLDGLPRAAPEISVYLPPPPHEPTPDHCARAPIGDGTSPAAV